MADEHTLANGRYYTMQFRRLVLVLAAVLVGLFAMYSVALAENGPIVERYSIVRP